MRERLERLDEACQVIRSLWTKRRSTFKGGYYQLSDAPLEPKPVQTPHPPPMIGGAGADAHDSLLAGIPEQIRERLRQVRAACVATVFIPTMFRPLPDLRRDLDRFIAEIAPEFR